MNKIFLFFMILSGDDLNIEVEIPFMTGVFGGQEKFRVRRLENCGTCSGNGIKPGAKVNTCNSCGGKGMVNNMQRTPFGVFNNVQTCPNCRGSGQEVEEYCPTCRGKGATSESKEVVFKVPSGVESGKLRFYYVLGIIKHLFYFYIYFTKIYHVCY